MNVNFLSRVVYFLAWLVFVGNAVCQPRNLGESVSALLHISLPYVSMNNDQIHEECSHLNENQNCCWSRIAKIQWCLPFVRACRRDQPCHEWNVSVVPNWLPSLTKLNLPWKNDKFYPKQLSQLLFSLQGHIDKLKITKFMILMTTWSKGWLLSLAFRSVFEKILFYCISFTDCPDGIVNIQAASGSIAYPESSNTYGENKKKCWRIAVPDAEIYRGIGIFYNT